DREFDRPGELDDRACERPHRGQPDREEREDLQDASQARRVSLHARRQQRSGDYVVGLLACWTVRAVEYEWTTPTVQQPNNPTLECLTYTRSKPSGAAAAAFSSISSPATPTARACCWTSAPPAESSARRCAPGSPAESDSNSTSTASPTCTRTSITRSS